MTAMTPKGRYDRVLAADHPDILPRIPILMQFAAEYIGRNYGAFASDHRVLVEAVRMYRDWDAGRHSILGWVEGPGALAADLRGLQEFYMDLLEDPDWCSSLLDICLDTGIRFAEAQTRAGADTIGVGDAMCSQI